jgi:flagella basal body P-ring formation protein FlgA
MTTIFQFLRKLFAVGGMIAALVGFAAAPVVPEVFLPQISSQLATHFGVAGELQLELLRSWHPPATPASDWKMLLVAPPPKLTPQLLVRVRLEAGDRQLGEWTLPLQARLWNDALAVHQPLDRGQTVNVSLFDLRRTDFLQDKDAVPASADLSGLAITRPLGAGELLTWRNIAKRSLVQRGQRIDVVATSGTLTITLKAQAMQNGALGETILVRNLDSRRDFSAVVTAENQARVTF